MAYRKRERSRSPVGRMRSKSPRDWKRGGAGEKRGGGGDKDNRDNLVRIYVSNLPYEMSWQELKDIFKDKVGNDIMYAQLYLDGEGRPSGAGVIRVKSQEVAENTIKIMDRYDIKGRKIVVREERDKDRQKHKHTNDRMGQSNNDMGDRFVSNMDWSRGGGQRGDSMGAPNMATNMVNQMNQQNRCFSVELMDQMNIGIKNITCQIFVANLDYKVTKSKLEEVFRMAGNVIDAQIKMDTEGKSRGIGIIRYEHPIESVQAITMFNNQMLYDRVMCVRMDKWVEPILQDIPLRLPSGLKDIGIGMGPGGQPLMNIGEVGNTFILSMFTGQQGNNQMNMANNTLQTLAAAAGLTNQNALNNLGQQLNQQANLFQVAGGGVNLNQMASQLLGQAVLGGAGGINMLNSLGLGSQGLLNAGLGGGLDASSLFQAQQSGGVNNVDQFGGSLGQVNSGPFDLLAASNLSNQYQNSSNLGSSSLQIGNNLGLGVGGGGSFDNRSSLGGMGGGNFDHSRIGGGIGGSGGGGGSSGGGHMLNNSFEGQRNGSIGLESGSRSGGENCAVFVKNLPTNFNTQNMYEKFRDCGDIKFAEVKVDNGGRSKGCGVVQFYNAENARRAISLLNGARIDNRRIEVRLDRVL